MATSNTGTIQLVNRKTKCKNIKIEDIKVNNMIRIGMVAEGRKFKAFKRSIELHGIIAPIIVKVNEDETYTIIDGTRRYFAAKELGYKKLKATIIEETKDIEDILGLVANTNQKMLTPIEMGIAYKRLIDSGLYPSKRVLAEALGLSEGSVGTKIKNLEMDKRIIEKLIVDKCLNDQKILKSIRIIEPINENGESEKQWALFNHIVDNEIGRKEALEYIKSQREPEIVSERIVTLSEHNIINLHIDTSELDEARKAKIQELIAQIEEIREDAATQVA